MTVGREVRAGLSKEVRCVHSWDAGSLDRRGVGVGAAAGSPLSRSSEEFLCRRPTQRAVLT